MIVNIPDVRSRIGVDGMVLLRSRFVLVRGEKNIRRDMGDMGNTMKLQCACILENHTLELENNVLSVIHISNATQWK